jgi:hypothetical protein
MNIQPLIKYFVVGIICLIILVVLIIRRSRKP